MYEAARHEPLSGEPWAPALARTAIDEIVADAIARFDPARFWPAHPLDEGFRDGSATLYAGASGVIWALDYLQGSADFRAILPRLLEACLAPHGRGRRAACRHAACAERGGSRRDLPARRSQRRAAAAGAHVGHARDNARVARHGANDRRGPLARRISPPGRATARR